MADARSGDDLTAEAIASGTGAVAGYEATMFARSGELAASANTALVQFFAPTSPDAPHLPPDHAREHEDYRIRAAEYRRRHTAI
ncbi:hypothetical protein [Cryptosporangium sp. NPDC051539]|uniref:hypothetical protein n=1 Tax=Cryptosporangium sp. NPDC051539 TaxID=3363962 RepID=UPI0037A5AC27